MTMILLRKDSFASRLTVEQREELFNALTDGMSYSEATEKITAWSVPERTSRPTETAVYKWYKRMKREKWTREQMIAEGEVGTLSSFAPGGASEDAAPRAAEGAARGAAEDAEMEEKARRGLLRARYYCVSEGLEPREVAAFERNEIWRQRLELDERKHEHAMLVDDMAKRLEAIEEQVAEMQENLDEMLEEVGADRAKRKAAFDSQVEINMVLIQLARMKTGNPYWVPDKGPDGRRHEAVPGQAPVPIETVERAVELMMRADIVEMQQAAEEEEAAAEKAEGLKGGKAEGNAEGGTRKAEGAAEGGTGSADRGSD